MMKAGYVILRYQPDLRKDHWFPIGIVAEARSPKSDEAAIVCFNEVVVEGVDELARDTLKNLSTVLRKDVQKCRDRLKPGEDFLEALRARKKWNLHFSVPQHDDVEAQDILDVAMDLFRRHVWARNEIRWTSEDDEKKITPRHLEYYQVKASA
jgi:hypothetical protein